MGNRICAKAACHHWIVHNCDGQPQAAAKDQDALPSLRVFQQADEGPVDLDAANLAHIVDEHDDIS